MRSPALVSVTAQAKAFSALFEAASERGVRIGWLERGGAAELPSPLAGAAESGAAKAVADTSSGPVSWKRRRGAAVLRDVVREHFLGYGVVLVRGGDALPRLTPASHGFRFETARGVRELEPDALLSELLRPRHRS